MGTRLAQNSQASFVSVHETWILTDDSGVDPGRANNEASMLRRWLSERKIFSVQYDGRELIPKFQIRNGAPETILERVIKVFPNEGSDWSIAQFLTSPNGYLAGARPMDLLQNDPDRIVSLARAFQSAADAF